MITFFKKKDEHEWLSNFADYPVQIGGKTHPTAEHAFQAAKFAHTAPEHAEAIRKAETPAKAKQMGKSRKHPIDPDWNRKRLHVMENILRAKLATNPGLAKRLAETGKEQLVEANPFDYFWGAGKSGKGQNHMGRLWEKIRDQ